MASTNYGISDTLEYIEYALDSADANTTPDSSFSSLNWPLFILSSPLFNIAALKVLEAEIPFTYYIFNSSNNTFWINEYTGAVTPGTWVQITIPVGNYTADNLATELVALLDAASLVGNTYTVTYSGPSSTPSTGKYTITASGGVASNPFVLRFGTTTGDTGLTNPRLWLGFNAGDTLSGYSGLHSSLTAPNIAQVTGPNYLYLNCRILGSGVKVLLPAVTDSLGGAVAGSRIARIPVDVQPGGTIYYTDPAPTMWFDLENLNNLAQIDFYFTMGNLAVPLPLDFNGSNFSLKLGILVNRLIHNDVVGGFAHTDRVVFRARPNGAF